MPMVAERLGRKWIACDASPRAIHTTTKRLLEARAPFEVWSTRDELHTTEHLSVNKTFNQHTLMVSLHEYRAPVPAEMRLRIQQWSDLVDYWEIDPDPCDNVFHSRWQSFRSRAQPELCTHAKFEVEGSRRGAIAVRLVDVLGRTGLVRLE